MKRFRNPFIKNAKDKIIDFFSWRLGLYNDHLEVVEPPQDFSYPVSQQNVCDSSPKATWINHSTFLIEVGGVNILTDPIWSNRCSPLSFVGPKRRHQPGIALSDLSHVDIVLISHDHYDHLDKFSIKKLHKRFPNILYYVPAGVKAWFNKLGIQNVIEMRWWQKEELHVQKGDIDIRLTAVPSQHFSGRSKWHQNATLWLGYIMEFSTPSMNKTLYFVGDTGYNPYDFKRIGERFPSIDLSLIPIGAYIPRDFMSAVHVCPDMAVKIHYDVGSKVSIGMHWKTFALSKESIYQPAYDLLKAVEKANLNPECFYIVEPGVSRNW